MSLTKCTANTDVISELADEPAMSATELKAKFDEAGENIKKYLNDVLTLEVDVLVAKTKTELSTKTSEVEASFSENINNLWTVRVPVLTEGITQNTDYTIPQAVGNGVQVYYEGTLLIKDVHYKETGSQTVQFIDWDVPAGSYLEFWYK